MSSATMEEELAKAGKQVLVEIVKLIQKRGMGGEKGGWKEFLKVYDTKLGDSLSDPARRSADVLMAFIKTFKEESDIQLFAKVVKCHTNRVGAKQILNSDNNESPEERLVRLTFEHPLYPIDYSFPSHEEDWVVTKLSKKNNNGRSNKLLALDCEMVICEDGSEALAKICVVDRGLKVKLHEFVNPGKVVVDYKTSITGVSAEDLSGTVTSLADIQRSVRRLLNGSILVGHSLSNDLKALKIDHARVIDTSFIFKYGDESTKRRPSLNDLCKASHEVRKQDAPHNCQDDACAAMKLVLAKLEKGYDNVLPVLEEKSDTVSSRILQESSLEFSDMKVQVNSGMYNLLLHRIPTSMPCEELNQIINGEFTIENSKRKFDRYSALLIFKTPEEAHQTFQDIVGDETMDTGGLPQKSISVQLKSGGTDTIYVRKMTRDNVVVSTKKRPCPAEEVSVENKVLKTDEAVDVASRTACVEHVEEIKWLKSVLSKRDEEISSLHKIIAALTRKQGL
ncbi:hypothetical protein V2J09_003838 [Rumex salicifolius]